MIKEDYVSFEVAKLLKEKGFNEVTLDSYRANGQLRGEYKYCNIPCPTHQMAMKWLREKDIIIVVQPEYFDAESKCRTWVFDIWTSDNYEKAQGDFLSYEGAVEAALKYSLENLL